MLSKLKGFRKNIQDVKDGKTTHVEAIGKDLYEIPDLQDLGNKISYQCHLF